MDVLEHPDVIYTNLGKKENVYIGNYCDKVNTKDVSSFQKSARKLQ